MDKNQRENLLKYRSQDFFPPPKTDHLFKLKRKISTLTFLLGFVILISSKISPFFDLSDSAFYKISFSLSIFLGFIYLFLDRKIKTAQATIDHFKSMLETKEDFYLIFREVLTVRPRIDFKTWQPAFLYKELPEIFDLIELQAYIVKWSRVNSVFAKNEDSEMEFPTIPLLIFPINGIKSLAMLLGSRQFTRLFMNASLKHRFIIVKEEIFKEDGMLISYSVALKRTAFQDGNKMMEELKKRNGKSANIYEK